MITTGAINWGSLVNRASPLNRGLVSWWLARGPTVNSSIWRDMAGNYNGTFGGSTAAPSWTTAEGRVGGNYSVAFDGSNDYVGLSLPSSLAFPYQLSFWQKPTTLSQNGIWISVAAPTTDKIAIGLYNTGNKIFVGTPATFLGLSGISTYLTAGKWQHISVTAGDATAAKLWIDGIPVTIASILDYYSAVSDNIGARNNGATFPFSGVMDDVRIHNRALSSDEVYQVYTDSLTGYQQTLNRLPRRFASATAVAGLGFNPLVGGFNPLQGFIAA